MPNAAGFLQGFLVRLHRHWHRFAPNLIKQGKGMTVPYIRLTGSNEGVSKQKSLYLCKERQSAGAKMLSATPWVME
jgi:hypothetical protein